ncbi:MAG: MFS transporter [Candidatus Thorarchaeota archaeon]
MTIPSLAGLFGLEQPTEKAIHLVRIFALLLPAFAVAFQISTTFWMIYIAESLGGGDYIAGLGLVGVLIVVQLVIQTLFDYPTGALGDHIGQRWVIASALICYAIAFWFTSIATPDSPFIIFIAIYVAMGLGSSQESGAWGAWFDNNYRVAMPNDQDRQQYGILMGRVGMVFEVISTLVLIPGAWLALIFARTWVFQLQAIISVSLAITCLIVVKDFPEVEEARKKRKSTEGYTSVLVDGFRFLVSDKFVLLSTLGAVIIFATGMVWWQLLLFPLYFTYLLTDVAVSSYRTMAFIPNVVAQERSGIWSRKFDPIKWIPRFRLLQFCGFVFYVLVSALTFLFPPPIDPNNLLRLYIPFTNLAIIEMPAESVIPMIILLFVFGVFDFSAAFANILTQRVMLDVIPNRIRNSMYSLQPTLMMMISVPLILAFGWILPAYGFPTTFILLSLIALVGALIVKRGFSYPIPKAEDLEVDEDSPEREPTEQEVIDFFKDLESSDPVEFDDGP